MHALRPPRAWLALAISARAIAARLDDPDAKKVMEDVADECEQTAQNVGERIDTMLNRVY